MHANANAATFFSTAALLMGVLVTIVGAALAQVLLSPGDAAPEIAYEPRRRLSLGVLAIVILVDVWGVSFPFWALYRSAIGSVTSSLVTGVFISTLLTGIANVVLPFYVVGTVRSARYWINLFRISRLDGDQRAAEIRKHLVDGKYISASCYDELMQQLKTRTLEYKSAVTLLDAFSKAFILGKREGLSSPLRTVSYYYSRIMIPAYARLIAADPRESKTDVTLPAVSDNTSQP